MLNALVRKLGNYTLLSADDMGVLDRIVRERVHHLRAREDLLREGDRPDNVIVVLTGWACRYKALEDGRRQIVGLFLPGDICDANVFLLREMDYSLGAVTSLTYAEITPDAFGRVVREQPRVRQALQVETLVTAAIQREWTFNLGTRSAFERLAHLFCELHCRLAAVGLTSADTFELPLTQADLAELAGLSAVHVNRTLQDLRSAGLIVFAKGLMTIPNLDALQGVAFFTPAYLHLDREGASPGTQENGL